MNSFIFRFRNCLILALFYSQFSIAETISYPVNPLVTKHAIFISENGITRFNKSTLKSEWSALDNIQTYEPVISNQLLLIGSNQGVFALNTITGEKIWHLKTGSILYTPSVEDNIAYIAGVNGTLRAVAVNTGKILWTIKLPGWIYPPAITSNTLITGGQHAVVWGIDKNSGTKIWEKNLSGAELVYRPILLSTGKVLLTTFAAKAIVISTTDGSDIWEITTKTATTNPVLFDHQLFLNGFDGSITSLNYQTGTINWTQQLKRGLLFSAKLYNGMLLSGDKEGSLHLIDPKTGKILQQFFNHKKMVTNPLVIGCSAVLPVIGRYSQIHLETRALALRPALSKNH